MITSSLCCHLRHRTSRRRSLWILSAILALAEVSLAFVAPNQSKWSSSLRTVHDDSAENFSEGAALAQEFSEYLKLKELQSKLIASEIDETAPKQELPPFSNRREIRLGPDGKPQDVPKSAGLFTNNPPVSLFSTPRPFGSVGTFDNTRDDQNVLPVSRLMLNSSELRLVRRAEIGLAVQMVVALLLLTGLIAVGISGGITDGSDRFLDGDIPDFFNPEAAAAAISTAVEEDVWI